jgi:hypothetical protein
MSYQLRRINPFWITHPMVPTAVAIGGILGLAGFATTKPVLSLVGGVVAGLGVLAGARPTVSALLGSLGLFGGLVTFVFVPNANALTMGLGMRIVSAVLFAAFYMVLMDALVLVVSVLYNFFAGALGMGGIRLELEGADEEEPAS